MGNDVSTPEEETTSRRCSSVAAAEFLGAPRTTETESDPTEPEASPTGAYASKLAAPYRMVRKTAASAASAGSKAWAAWSAAGTKASEKEEQLRELIRQRIEGRMEPADEIHELCATVNHELDYHEDPATFRAALQAAYGDELQEAELIVQDNLHSRIGFAVNQGVTVVAWRGSKTLVELGTDAGFSPSLCHLWFDLTDQIQAHGAMMAVIEHDFLVFRKRLAARLSALDVGRLVFSGHSLGGGLAQIAHLALLGEQHAGRFSNLVVESVVFASPMVFFVAADTTEATQSVLQELFRSSVNYILHNDATPRMPGLPEFWVPALKEAAKAMVRKGFAEKGSHLQRAVKWKLIFGDGRVDILFDLLERRTQYALDTCRGYRHTCKLLLVPLYDANQGILEMGFEEFASMPYCAECDSDEMLHIEAEFAWIIHVCLPRNFARTYRPFRLKHAASGLCIACTEEGQLQLRNNWGSNHDELFWRRLHVQINVRPPDGTFRLASKASQRWLTVEGSDLQTSDDDVDEQYWTLFLRGDGEYHLESYSSSKLLAVIGPPGQERLGLCSKTQPGEQRWKLIPQKQKPGTHPQSEEN